MRVLELFSGSRTLSSIAKEKFNARTMTVDKFIESDFQIYVQDLSREMIIEFLGYPDIIWASPVCSAWSKTGWFHYWDTEGYSRNKKFVAKDPFATESVKMVSKTIKIFSWFPDAQFWMENPEGMLYRHPVMNNFSKLSKPIKRHKITYCRYGDSVMKPTHIWTNSTTWKPRRPCNNGNGCHMKSPRCSQNGIRAKTNSFERSKLPVELCNEILKLVYERTQEHTTQA